MLKRQHCLIAFSCCLPLALGCSASTRIIQSEDASAPLYKMGRHHRVVTTSSAQAQQYFDQGLIWAYAFNHDEAIRSFEAAIRLDPDCAMAWWGIALCNGPHINNPVVPPERSIAAWEALQKALALQNRVSPTEKALILALSHRYAKSPTVDRQPLDQAYADAMRGVWLSHRDDPDIGTLYAEALMDLHPWDLWTKEGQPKQGTNEILAVLEEVLHMNPLIPGANHLYIHTVEASPNPERGNIAADRLRKMVPASGHLVHMPSHIDVLTGRWAKASKQNERAIKADRKYRTKSPKQEFYRLYMAHNHHMLSFASMMEGRSEVAIRAARELVASIPKDYLQQNAALMDTYTGAIYDALKRFGLWDEILSEPAPPTFLPVTTAMWRYARGLAYAAKGEIQQAEHERVAFQKAVSIVSADAILSINPAKKVLKIAEHMLDGEIALARGDTNASVEYLRKAIAIEDDLLYMEPPEWMQPVRHTLGAVLLSAGRYQEAESVYREDLADWPSNGWSLYGLSRCLRARGANNEAKAMETRFRRAWSRSDISIGSSCLCVPKT